MYDAASNGSLRWLQENQPEYCFESRIQISNGTGPFEACCDKNDQCLDDFICLAPPAGISSNKGRCNAQCFMTPAGDADFGKVGTCCIKESDCLNGNCEYGRCVSNCNEADYLKKNRFVGDCCDYDSHCASGLSCYASMQTCQVSGSNAITEGDGGNQEFTGETENENPLDSGDDKTVIQPPANEPESIDNGSTGDQSQSR